MTVGPGTKYPRFFSDITYFLLTKDFYYFAVVGHSVYVGNLPLDATVEQLEEQFKKFGPIRHGGVQIRSNKVGTW